MNTMYTDTVTTTGTVQGANDTYFYISVEGVDELIPFEHNHGERGKLAFQYIKGTDIKVIRTYCMGTVINTQVTLA